VCDLKIAFRDGATRLHELFANPDRGNRVAWSPQTAIIAEVHAAMATAQLDRKEMVSKQPEALCADSMINCMGITRRIPKAPSSSGVPLLALHVFEWSTVPIPMYSNQEKVRSLMAFFTLSIVR